MKLRCMIVMLGLLTALSSTAQDAGDAALVAACPALAAWSETHPRHSASAPDEAMPIDSPALRAELSKRATTDQRAREFMTNGNAPSQAQVANLQAVDSGNLQWLKALIARQGFPTAREVGNKGVSDAWLLVQHADMDPSFQRAVLDALMADIATRGDLKPEIAMLYDRVQLAEGKAQRYGTQFERNENGDFVPKQPVDDLPNIDIQRAAVGLMPLDLYRCVLRNVYGPPAHRA
ncbi:DUF6624 domain-containing protein [Lysobacter sp. 2RAF19]